MKNYVTLNFFIHLYMPFQSCAICKIADDFFFMWQIEIATNEQNSFPGLWRAMDMGLKAQSEESSHLTSLCKLLMGMIFHWDL